MKKVTAKIVNGYVQIPNDVPQRLKESDDMPIGYTKDCPKLTRKQIAQFSPVGENFLKQKKIKHNKRRTTKKSTL